MYMITINYNCKQSVAKYYMIMGMTDHAVKNSITILEGSGFIVKTKWN